MSKKPNRTRITAPKTAAVMLAAMLKDAAFLMLPVLLGTSVWLAILRLDNIGLNRWLSVIAAIPTAGLIFAIYLACAATGSGRRRRSKDSPPNRN